MLRIQAERQGARAADAGKNGPRAADRLSCSSFSAALVGAAVLAATMAPAAAAIPKASASRAAFQRAHPCPATGKPWGPCHGWVAMYVKPLCAGGLDDASNLQWQTLQDAQMKRDKDRSACRR